MRFRECVCLSAREIGLKAGRSPTMSYFLLCVCAPAVQAHHYAVGNRREAGLFRVSRVTTSSAISLHTAGPGNGISARCLVTVQPLWKLHRKRNLCVCFLCEDCQQRAMSLNCQTTKRAARACNDSSGQPVQTRIERGVFALHSHSKCPCIWNVHKRLARNARRRDNATIISCWGVVIVVSGMQVDVCLANTGLLHDVPAATHTHTHTDSNAASFSHTLPPPPSPLLVQWRISGNGGRYVRLKTRGCSCYYCTTFFGICNLSLIVILYFCKNCDLIK